MADKKTIIVLEDDPVIRRLYRTLFLKAGFDVRAYKDAVDIAAKVRSIKPDLILTDLLMPKIDGYDVLRTLKADPATRTIPIAVISNLGDYVSQQKSAYLGAVDFIVKSNMAPSALVLRVRDIMEGKVQPAPPDPKILEFLKADERAKEKHAQLSPEEKQYA